MIDNFSLLLTHGLLIIVAWRLMSRPDLDQEAPPAPDDDDAAEGFAARPRAKARAKGWGRRDA